MSSSSTDYRDGEAVPLTLDAIRNRACALPFADAGYRPPRPDEVRALIKLMGWSQVDVAKLTGVGYRENKGSTAVRRWQTSAESDNHREIPYSAWRLLLLSAGVVTVEQDRAGIALRVT